VVVEEMSRLVSKTVAKCRPSNLNQPCREPILSGQNKGECSYRKHTKADFNTQQQSSRVSCLLDTYYPDAFAAAVGADVGAVTLRASCMSTGIMDPAHDKRHNNEKLAR